MNSVENIPPPELPVEANRSSEATFVAVNTSDVAVRRDTSSSLESSGDVESAVAALAVSVMTPVERGHGVLAVLRKMVYAESGSHNLAAGLGRFLERMWSGPHREALVRSVQQRATALASGRVGEGLEEGALIDDLRAVVDWYTVRRMSLAACRREGFMEGDPDALFNLHIAHDVRRWGVDGLVVSCGLRFIARAHETVWFKVTARTGRKDVLARAGWSAWRDETDTVAASSGETPYRFAAIAPLRPLRQRCVVDYVDLFVPYAALDLPVGRHDLELEAGMYTQAGELVLATTIGEAVQIAPFYNDAPVIPAPQAIGVWELDPVVGHRIAITGAHTRLEGDPGWEEEVVEARVDTTLVGFLGERLELEARLRQSDGSAVRPWAPPAEGSLEPCLARVGLLPQQIVSRIEGIPVRIPLRELDLSPGSHRLFLEAVVNGADGKVICGVVAPVTVAIAEARREPEVAPPAESVIASDAAVDVTAVTVTPSVRAESPALEVAVSVSARAWESSHYRLLTSLECRDGASIRNVAAADRPVLRSIWFGGERRAPGETGVVRAVFDAREFARFLKTRPAAERDIVVRIVIANEAGRVVFETTRIGASDFAADVRVALPAERSVVPMRLVAAELEDPIELNAGPMIRVTLNVLRAAHPSNRCTVYYDFIDAAGEPFTRANDSGDLHGDVATVALPFCGVAVAGRWYQTTVVVPCGSVLSPGEFPAGMNVTMFSPTGEFWETAYYPLPRERGKVATRRRISSTGPAEGGSAAPSGAGALLSKIRSALIG